ncbi:MAG: hypothetical protein N2257_01465 [Thermodesulfovibrionales bacterium]|nr:hypothetical protein [Thermodesulfovibrionales bacterium]
MAKEEIEKLKEKVEKDPLSKLFVPLAEEYRKMGMLDEAISVLLKGLESQPSYMTARVALGKIYLEKKMLREAKEEFKKVVTAIPDNLFALKKIAEISAELGEIPEAIDAYSRILKLNPLDEEAKLNLEELKSKKIEERIPEPPASKPIELKSEQKTTSAPHEEKEPEHFELEGFMPLSQTSFSDDEFEKFKNEFYSKEILHDETPEMVESTTGEIEKPANSILSGAEPPTEEIQEIQEISEDDFFIESSKSEMEESVLNTQYFKADSSERETIRDTKYTIERTEPDFSYPDRLIAQGNYIKALEAYKKMLEDYPGDRRVIQRLEELKTAS